MSKYDITNADQFKSLIENKGNKLVIDFYADWCGPCKMLAPILEKLADNNQLDSQLVKVNVDLYPELASMFSVAALPTLVKTVKGEVVKKITGFRPEEVLLKELND